MERVKKLIAIRKSPSLMSSFLASLIAFDGFRDTDKLLFQGTKPSESYFLEDFHYYLCRRLGGGMEIFMDLTDEIKKYLYCCGADLIGIAVALPENIIADLQKAPTEEYYNLYYSLNKKLNEIVMAGENFLKKGI